MKSKKRGWKPMCFGTSSSPHIGSQELSFRATEVAQATSCAQLFRLLTSRRLVELQELDTCTGESEAKQALLCIAAPTCHSLLLFLC